MARLNESCNDMDHQVKFKGANGPASAGDGLRRH